MNEQYSRLLANLDEFINRYYFDRLIRGVLFFLSLILTSFLLLVLLEHFFYFSEKIRLVFLLSFVLISSFAAIYWIIVPVFKRYRVIPAMSHKDAALLIGSLFDEIKDKIFNTIQLFESANFVSSDQISLLNASVEQRVRTFGIIRFKNSIRLRLNKKYLKYALPPLAIIISLALGFPTIVTAPAQRIIFYDSTFIPPAPFKFVLLNSDLSVIEKENFKVSLKLVGKTVPSDVLLLVNGSEYLMNKESSVRFFHQIENITEDIEFQFFADGFYSEKYYLNLVLVPKILNIDVETQYPSYIQKTNEIFNRVSELTVPEGTNLIFKLKSKNTDTVYVVSGLDFFTLPSPFRLKLNRIKSSTELQFIPHGFETISDTILFPIRIIKDEFPEVRVTEFTDSVFENRKFFKGFIKDDYGFSSLKFEVNFKTLSDKDTTIFSSMEISNYTSGQDFYHFFDFSDVQAKDNSVISYSFVVADNDAVNGPKISRSAIFSKYQKSNEELLQDAQNREKLLTDAMQNQVEKAAELFKQVEQLQQKIRGKKELEWEDKNQLSNLLDKFNELQKNIEKSTEQFNQNSEKVKNELKQTEELQKKQEELAKLLEEVLTPEMKLMLEEMKKMVENNTKKEDIEKGLEQMKFDSEYLKEQLERELEMMKQLKFDNLLQQNIDKLNELEKEQKKLLDSEKMSKDEELEKQEAIGEEFKKLQNNMDSLRKANNDLKEPNKLPNTEKQEAEIEQNLNESEQSLKQGKQKEGAKNQQNAMESMQKLSEQLENAQESMQQDSEGEDIENLKNILHNLLEISFNQENLINKVRFTSNRDPKFPSFIEEQKRIMDDIMMVEDSLKKIALRNPSIDPVVSRELKAIAQHSEASFLALKELNTIGPTSRNSINQSTSNQQFIMTSVNNLALMLSEALNQMQQQQMQSKSGKGSCKNPKPGSGGQAKIKSMREMQQALQKQMEQMKKGMEQQGKGPKDKGSQSGKGGEKLSEEMARMAAQQEALRKMLQEYRERVAKEGKLKEAGSLGEAARQMEQIETELVNKMITAESLKRQKEIITRLLESERADREREMDEKRKSVEGKNPEDSNKNLILKYKEFYKEDTDMIKTVPPNLKTFYKRLVNSYLD